MAPINLCYDSTTTTCSSPTSCKSSPNSCKSSSLNASLTDIKRCGACILSPDKKSVLLVKQREAQKWGFPKGSKEHTESCMRCMKREVWEETGLKLKYFKYDIMKRYQCYSCIIYMIHMQDEASSRACLDPQDTGEIEKVAWVPIKELLHYRLNNLSRSILFACGILLQSRVNSYLKKKHIPRYVRNIICSYMG